MTIKAQRSYFWGRFKRPIRELNIGEEITRLGMIDPFTKDAVGEVARVVSPEVMVLRQKLVGVPWIDERPLKINIGGKETDRLVQNEITEYGSWQTLGDLLIGYRDRVWWEPTEGQTFKERGR